MYLCVAIGCAGFILGFIFAGTMWRSSFRAYTNEVHKEYQKALKERKVW